MDETFDFLIGRWNVTKAKEITKGRSPKGMVSVNDLSKYLGVMRIDKDHAKNTDVTKPIICILVDEYALPIDGWHRIYRAHQEGIEYIEAHVLTKEESDSIRIT